MKRTLIFAAAVILAGSAAPLLAASGENWEITTRAEMSGMPSALPEMTMNVCLPKGAERDPRKLVRKDDNCEVTDVKSAGSKTTWKMRCRRDGDDMTGSGEVKYKGDSFQGTTRLSGKSGGEAVDMTANYQGKKIGSTCDPSAPPVNTTKGMEDMNELMGMAKSHMASAMAEQCQVSNHRATELISSMYFGPGAACKDNEKFACKVISKEVTRDVAVYVKLAKHDDTSDLSIAGVCKIDMAAATKAVCGQVDGSNHRELADYCPAEANAFNIKQSGNQGGADGESDPSILDNARKLKGLFGF